MRISDNFLISVFSSSGCSYICQVGRSGFAKLKMKSMKLRFGRTTEQNNISIIQA